MCFILNIKMSSYDLKKPKLKFPIYNLLLKLFIRF